MNAHVNNIALIGAGPLGIEIAVALSRAKLSYVHLEAGQIGSTMQWWPYATRWFSSNERISIAGVPLVTPTQEKATREEYLAYLRSVVQQFHLPVQTYTHVRNIAKLSSGEFVLAVQKCISGQHIGAEQQIRASKVILATGGTASPMLLNIPGENLPHVSHYFKDPHAFFQKTLLIVGGRNSAVEAALRCHRAGAKVHFSYRRTGIDPKDIKYWLYPEFSFLVKSGEITPHFSTMPTRIAPTHVTLTSTAPIPADAPLPVTEYSELTTPMVNTPVPPKPAYDLPVDFVLLLTGYRADMSLAKGLGVTLSSDQEIPTYNPETMETNVPGVYIAGTAIAGTQGGPRRYKVFLENCIGVHASRILGHFVSQGLISAPPPGFERLPEQKPVFELPEA